MKRIGWFEDDFEIEKIIYLEEVIEEDVGGGLEDEGK